MIALLTALGGHQPKRSLPADIPAAPVTIKIDPGGGHVTGLCNDILSTVLGSCVSACIRNPVTGVGGMNHFMLPYSATGLWASMPDHLCFGNFAMEWLVDSVLEHGGTREQLEIKIFGGSDIAGAGIMVGARNAEYAEDYLHRAGLPIAAQHLRGTMPRRLRYHPASGRVLMQTMPLESPPNLDASPGRGEHLETPPLFHDEHC